MVRDKVGGGFRRLPASNETPARDVQLHVCRPRLHVITVYVVIFREVCTLINLVDS